MRDVELTVEQGLLTSMVREVLQAGIDVEMTEHLGHERYSPEGRGSPNRRKRPLPEDVQHGC